MEDIISSLDWRSSEVPSPGSHSSLPDDDILPWQCVSEVIPGLYLTCESEVADKKKCLENGNALVINMCGSPHTRKYRVYEKDGSDTYAFRRFESQSEFYVELNNYCQGAALISLDARKIFYVTISAEDLPTYSIDLHFLECSVLIELVLRSRQTAERHDDADYAAAPSVVVHCMVGVSRSAAVVIAYMMKKYNISRDAAIRFIRCTRPVIQPNPGFQRQLELWESLGGFRIADEMSVQVLSSETKAKANLLNVVSTILPTILRTNKCDNERCFFGTFIKNASSGTDELHAVYRELRSTVTADVDCEVYTDIPNYFGYVAEIVCSVDTTLPSFMQYASFSKQIPTCNDTFYYRVMKDVARSGFEKDTFDTARGFCSLFEAIYLKHLRQVGDGRPRLLSDKEESCVSVPTGCGLSFPFLFLVAPYAEGFVQFREWDALAEAFSPTGATLSAEEEWQLTTRVLDSFFQFFFRSSCGCAESTSATETNASVDAYSKLAYLQEDMELVTFRKLEELWRSSDSIASAEVVVSASDSDDAQIFLMLVLKAISGIVAFRIVLEAAEQFLTQTYAARLSGSGAVADKKLSLPVISAAITSLDSVYAEKYGSSSNVVEFFNQELSGLRESGVLNTSGVVSLFHTSS
ncbi:putative dual-specificity protein phosphatase [Leptomonas pyrrhocoris]|uniref:Putative dual-specificity protein phosphatase n=1 Tax=Leptomonas pyrrhocoris TaxID=157538 RepID=A0A0N0DZQ1_LEPPY|nr:putative dual-specificity protein phosphatase [Leptomonas pyrrhocoris]KPA85462.1 putative dual-specificity protein phosphatase [Leptomonas pyrrhocoris]|eukprot:XP_015663901.1 putative dual-specificity protein phosphatase [Leptomonas pyrrhocoris]